MRNIAHTEKHHGLTIHIRCDEDCEDPRIKDAIIYADHDVNKDGWERPQEIINEVFNDFDPGLSPRTIQENHLLVLLSC